jgi:hypothetical protein
LFDKPPEPRTLDELKEGIEQYHEAAGAVALERCGAILDERIATADASNVE